MFVILLKLALVWKLLDLLSRQWKPERVGKQLVRFCDGAEEYDESYWTELTIEEGEGLEEYKEVDEEEEEDDDGNKKEDLVSTQDMEHSVIVIAPWHWV